MSDTKIKLKDIKPKDPKDPKIPSFLGSLPSISNEYVANDEEENNFILPKIDNKTKSKALSWIRNAQASANVINELDPKTHPKQIEPSGEIVQPDPNYTEKFIDYRNIRNQKVEIPQIQIRNSNDFLRSPIEEKNISKIKSYFKEKIIKITKKFIIIKYSQYGMELFYNSIDKRYWVVGLKFMEPLDPKDPKYLHIWNGNTFIGYGYPTFEEMLTMAKKICDTGRLGNVAWNDFVVSYDEKAKRIHTNDIGTVFTYEELKKFITFFNDNKIWIFVKPSGSFDAEDLMIQAREKAKKGEPVNPLDGIRAKILSGPRKPLNIHVFPVKDSKYSGEEYEKPKNKKYKIGFTYSSL